MISLSSESWPCDQRGKAPGIGGGGGALAKAERMAGRRPSSCWARDAGTGRTSALGSRGLKPLSGKRTSLLWPATATDYTVQIHKFHPSPPH